MTFILGEDNHGVPVGWWAGEGNQNVLAVSGEHDSGKTMLADSIMLQALVRQYAVIRFDLKDKPLPSPIVSPVDYEDKIETLNVLDRTIAEIKRRGTYREKHGVEGEPTPRPLLLVFEDLDSLMESDDRLYLRELNERLQEIRGGIIGMRVYLVLVSTTFPTDGQVQWKNIVSHSGHVHLGYSPIEEYVLPSNREQASQILTRMADHSFRLRPGQGFYEDRFGELKPIMKTHDLEGGNRNA